MQILDLPKQMTNTHTDVVIVGSGPIGVSCAIRFARKGLTVAVLEQGEAITDPAGSHLRNQPGFQHDPDAFFGAVEPFLQPVMASGQDAVLPGIADTTAIGGQGVLWTNNCPRASVFERFDALGDAQWNDYYGEAETALQVTTNAATGSRVGANIKERLLPGLRGEGRTLQSLPFSGGRAKGDGLHFAGTADLLTAVDRDVRERIRIYAPALAHKILYKNGKVTGVAVQSGDTNDQVLSAGIFLIAGGALGTPRLLHKSGIRPEALGRGFSFHALYFAQLVLSPELASTPARDDVPPRYWIAPTLNAPWHIQVLRDTCPLPVVEAVDNPNRMLEFQAFLPVEFNQANSLSFNDDGKISVTYAFSERDREGMQRLEDDIRHLGEKLGPWRRGGEPVWVPAGTSHLVGTCRMDCEGTSGVSDRNAKVHGFDNLYLAGAGVIPAPVAVNPTLTALALAFKSCDHALQSA
ncbi:GMC oxidoreductase [uncultured Roseibium sp.]|uniref:GMC oxidoreductase n=1 Tax=uncultured Roseibium sp. TaxID=1936171 RepID=UPI00262A6D92|nr:GMC oxidoreductase [uncultured Roseibium sp.]